MDLVAHRAANRAADVLAGLAAADIVELDVHLHRGRLEVRHAKVLWPTSRLWERWHWVRDPPEALDAILAAAPEEAHLWFDLKGFTSRLARRVLVEIEGRPVATISCRSWWALRPVRRRAGVRTARSVGARWQLLLATRRSAPSPDGHVLANRFANPATVTALRRRHPFVAVWGVTDLLRLDELERMGVTAVIADDLTMLATARAARGPTVSPPASAPPPDDPGR